MIYTKLMFAMTNRIVGLEHSLRSKQILSR